MKYKKQIAMICLITFLFLPISGKYEEPKAEILTLTAGTIIACAALATAAGVIITNPDMLQDVGERIYDGIKNIPNAIENVGDNIKINVTKEILNTVISVCDSIPKIEYVKSIIDSYLDDNIYGFGGYSLPSDVRVGSLSIMPLSGNDSSSTSLKIKISYGSYSFGTFNFPFDEPVDISFDLSSKDGKIFVNSVPYSVTYGGTLWQDYSLRLSLPSNWNGTWRVLGYESEQSICIPYTPENTENVSADKPKEYFPVGSGSISVPIDTPLSNYNPSVDNPISLPTDLVGDGISADVDTSTDTGAIDKPNVDVGETPTTGESLWDTLLSWLSSLFAPLVALLEWIGSILTSILDFLGSLVSSLVDAIVSLFSPTVAVDELFSISEGSGFSDILSLFDWGLFDIEPKPYEFVATLDFMSLVDNTSNPQVIEIKLFDNELVKKYLPYVRNILSYSLLISTISMIVWHFIPKRDID